MFVTLKFKNLSRIIALVLIVLSVSIAYATTQTAKQELPIIMYHSVLKDKNRIGKYVVTPEIVEGDIQYLQSRGYKSISCDMLIDYVENGTPLPEKCFILTFDDGCYNNLCYMLPILEKYDCYAVFSVVGKYSEEYSDSDEVNPAYSYLRWCDIKDAYESGRIEIGNHSYDMHSVNSNRMGAKKKKGETCEIYKTKFLADCCENEELLFENCNIKPIIYAYPFGATCKEAEECLREKGYKVTFDCTERVNVITNDSSCLYSLGRFNRSGFSERDAFFNKILKK